MVGTVNRREGGVELEVTGGFGAAFTGGVAEDLAISYQVQESVGVIGAEEQEFFGEPEMGAVDVGNSGVGGREIDDRGEQLAQ